MMMKSQKLAAWMTSGSLALQATLTPVFAQDRQSVDLTHDYGKGIHQLYGEVSSGVKEHGQSEAQCRQTPYEASACSPTFKRWAIDDLGSKNFVQSNYYTCTKNVMGKFDYDNYLDLKSEVESRLKGRVDSRILHSVNACAHYSSAKDDSKAMLIHARHVYGKAAYALQRFELAQQELYKQLSFADAYLGDRGFFKNEKCANAVFSGVEKSCNNLQTNCSKSVSTEQSNNLIDLSREVSGKAQELEAKIKKATPFVLPKPTYVAQQEGALELLKKTYPWVFGSEFKKWPKDVTRGLIAQIAANRKELTKTLAAYKRAAECFRENPKAVDCAPEKLNELLIAAPALPGSSGKWDLNMQAEECVAGFSFERDQLADLFKNSAITVGLTAATMGMGTIANLGRVVNAGKAARNAALGAEAGVLGIDAAFLNEAVVSAMNACTSPGLGSVSAAESNQCPGTEMLGSAEWKEEGNCKLAIAMAVAQGTPLGMAVKDSLAASKKTGLTEKGRKLAKQAKEKLASSLDSFMETRQMTRDRGEAEYLAELDPRGTLGLRAALDQMKQKGGKLLISGSGEDKLGEQLARQSKVEVTSVDLQTNAQDIAKSASGGSRKVHSGKPLEDVALPQAHFDSFVDMYGAFAYSSKPDRVMQNLMDSLKTRGEGFVSLGQSTDYFGKANRIVTRDGRSLTLTEWLQTIPGMKVEITRLDTYDKDTGLMRSDGMVAKVTKISDDVKIPQLQKIFGREKERSENGLVPIQYFAEAGARKTPELPKVVASAFSGRDPHTVELVTTGVPSDVLLNLSRSGKKLEFDLGYERYGIGSRAEIVTREGRKLSLAQWLQEIPGSKASSTSTREKRFMGERQVLDGDSIHQTVSKPIYEAVQREKVSLEITDPAKFEAYLKEQGRLELLGTGAPTDEGITAPIYRMR